VATCTHRVSTASSTNNAATYASGAFTPGAGEVLVAMVTVSGHTNATPTLSSSVAGQSFYLATTQLYATSANRIYIFVGRFFAAASSQTVTFNASPATITGCTIQVVGVAGMFRTGEDAVRQVAGQANQAAGTPAPAFGVAALTSNPTIGLVGNSTNPATMTTPTNWTEANDTGYATPATGSEYVTRNSGFTGTTVTWGSASGSVFGSSIIELDTTDTAVVIKNHRFDLQAVNVAANF
jgi:hypothetical protein